MAEASRETHLIYRFLGLLVMAGAIVLSLTTVINGGFGQLNVRSAYGLLQEPDGSALHLGDLPVEGDAVQDAGAEWRDLESYANTDEAAAYAGIFWIRRTLPDLPLRDPALHIRMEKHYQVYINGRLADEYNWSPPDPRVNNRSQLRLIPLPEGPGGATVHIRVYREGGQPFLGEYRLAEARDVYVEAVRHDALKLVFSIALLFAGILALIATILNRRQWLQFALLALSAGIGCISRSSVIHFYFDASRFAYWSSLALPLGAVAFFAFLQQAFGKYTGSWLRWLWPFMSGYTAACGVAGWANPDVYHWMTQQGFIWLSVLLVAYGAGVIVRYCPRRPPADVQWLLLGCLVILLTACLHYLLNYEPPISLRLYELAPVYFYFWKEDVIYFGILLFVVCLGYVIVGRYNAIHRQLLSHAEELARNNERLQELDRLKDDFLANTSHELRTPLQGIIGLAESLLNDPRLPEEKRAHQLSLIVYSGKRLNHLIDDLLDIARLKHRDVAIAARPLNVRDEAELVLAVLKTAADRKGLRLINDIPDHAPSVMADEDRLQQILLNLIGNAIKFTDRGEVRLTARPVGEFMHVDVADTGIGIPRDKWERIFEPFEQADGSDTRSYGGTGLGLSITKNLVELHGGRISVRSEVGHGTVFTFSLPLSDQRSVRPPLLRPAEREYVPMPPEQLTAAATEEELFAGIGDGEPSADKATILLVDDDPVILQVWAGYLNPEAYRVLFARSGEEALRLVEEVRPDLVLLDVMMPKMNGIELCRRIRAFCPASELPIVLVTAKNRIADLVDGFEAGANDYLTKPVGRGELLARVGLQLQLQRVSRTAARAQTKAVETVRTERDKIAHDIHDIVGYTLTSTIVQIEAVRRLLAKNTEAGIERLDFLEELVRNGLEEMRRSVRMLKGSVETAGLEQALLRLVQDTERSTGVEIDVSIEPSPLPELSLAQGKALYHAVQEGFTNGIRHGGSTRFSLRLMVEGEDDASGRWLRLVLSNNGKPFANNAPGIGLQGMRERIEAVGGTMEIAALRSEGCKLEVRIPLSPAPEPGSESRARRI